MPDTRSYLFLLGFFFFLFIGVAFADGTILQDADRHQIEIRNVSAVVSKQTITYSATYFNLLDSNVTFDAVIRLDDNDNVLALDPYRISLRARAVVSVQGMFVVEREGNYTVQWEALSLPPGENISGRQRIQVEGEFEFDNGMSIPSLVLAIIISSLVVSTVVIGEILMLRSTRIRNAIAMEKVSQSS
ncbi:MAG: hypothetical protein V3U49_00105 [Nitrososphaerales archaeon]